MGSEFPVHDVSCRTWDSGGTNDMWTCDFKYMELPWMSDTKIEKVGSLILLHKKDSEDWWIPRNQ